MVIYFERYQLLLALLWRIMHLDAYEIEGSSSMGHEWWYIYLLLHFFCLNSPPFTVVSIFLLIRIIRNVIFRVQNKSNIMVSLTE